MILLVGYPSLLESVDEDFCKENIKKTISESGAQKLPLSLRFAVMLRGLGGNLDP